MSEIEKYERLPCNNCVHGWPCFYVQICTKIYEKEMYTIGSINDILVDDGLVGVSRKTLEPRQKMADNFYHSSLMTFANQGSTRMHSSRMRTVHNSSRLLEGWCLLLGGGCSGGACSWGGVCSRASAPGGLCLLQGVVIQHAVRQSPLWTDTQV